MAKQTLLEHIEWDAQEHEVIRKSISRIELALFGDETLKQKGMVVKMDELYEVFIQSNGVIKFGAKFIALIGLAGGIVLTFLKISKVIK